jgi:hypothetical protein
MIPDPDRFVANLRLLNDVLAESPIADHYQLFGGLLLGMEREGRPLAHDPDADFFPRGASRRDEGFPPHAGACRL